MFLRIRAALSGADYVDGRDPIAAMVVKKSAYWTFAAVLAPSDAVGPQCGFVDASAIFTLTTRHHRAAATSKASGTLRALVQSRDRIQSRQHGPFLPGRQPRAMLARQNQPVIDRAHIIVVLGTARFRPASGAAQGEGHA